MQGSLFFITTMKKLLTTAIALSFLIAASAQSADDACRFAQNQYHGTAKALGMGNALGAVGGDMTAVCINPAGMGIYRSDEITFSLNLLDNYSQSSYYGTDRGANKLRLTIPNLAYVGHKERSNFKPLRSTQFGIGLTRTNDYNMHLFARGINPTSSIIDNYLAQIDGYSVDELQDYFPNTVYPAWRTFLVDLYEDSQGAYYSSPVPQGGIWQSVENNFRGRSEEWSFAGSANYYDRLFVGISVNLAHITRTGERVKEESHPDGADPETGFNEWSFSEDLSSSGWGVNAKVGLIFHATSWLRLGAAFHSPTIYAFNETWQTETESEISYVIRKYSSPESHYEYTFIKPLRWVGSMAFVVGQQGMVSIDAEYTNYGAARFKAVADDDYDYTPTNEQIKETYGRTVNFRIGTEWDLNGTYLRMGAGYYGSPLGFGKTNGSVKTASLGVSVPVSADTSFDFAYELAYSKHSFELYDAGVLGIQPVTQRQFRNNLMTTLKVKF